MTRKTYVLDTSVLLAAPGAFTRFAEHEVVIPLVVISELESKRNSADLGYQARKALRGLDAVIDSADIGAGVCVNDQGGTVRIEVNHIDQSGLPDAIARDSANDARILAVAKNLANEGHTVTVVSKDLPMRIKAKVLGLGSEEYRNEMIVVDQAYSGIVEVEVTTEALNNLYASKDASLPVTLADLGIDTETAPANTGLSLISPSGTALAIVNPDKSVRLFTTDTKPFGVSPRSKEQKFAVDHMLNTDIGIVSLRGMAGTGKSFMAIAAGLEAVMERRTHDKVVIFRPLFAVGGQELGYLPGDQNEKMGPWAAAVYDALENMVGKDVRDAIAEQKLIEVLPLTHIRGRTLSKTFTIIDEAQNLELPVLLTALSRMGEDSKVVLSWDDAQRDNLHVGRYDGIAAVVEKFKGDPLFAHVTFTKSERGPIAAMVTRMLDAMIS